MFGFIKKLELKHPLIDNSVGFLFLHICNQKFYAHTDTSSILILYFYYDVQILYAICNKVINLQYQMYCITGDQCTTCIFTIVMLVKTLTWSSNILKC